MSEKTKELTHRDMAIQELDSRLEDLRRVCIEQMDAWEFVDTADNDMRLSLLRYIRMREVQIADYWQRVVHRMVSGHKWL